MAAETSALTIIGVPAMAYGGNIAFLQMIIGYVIARIILAVVLVPHYFKGEIYSPYQLFANTFGPSARQTAGGFFLISETLAAGVRVYVASIPVKLMLGDKLLGFGTGDPILGAILLFVLLSLLYTYVGGVKAVIWTDAVQFGLFLLGGLFALFYIPSLVDGGVSAVFSQAAAGRQAALAECGSAARDIMAQVFVGRAVQYLDGGHRRHGPGDVLARRGTVDRATRAGLQNRGRWTKGAGPERRGDLPAVFDLPAGGRDALGFLPGASLSKFRCRNRARLRHQSQRFHLPHFHDDGSAARAERFPDRGDFVGGDVVGQFRAHVAGLGFDDGFRETCPAGTQ